MILTLGFLRVQATGRPTKPGRNKSQGAGKSLGDEDKTVGMR